MLILCASRMDDDTLQLLAATVPRRSILLIEDIDCAFAARGDQRDAGPGFHDPRSIGGMGNQVTMSGLLNILDGVVSPSYLLPCIYF